MLKKLIEEMGGGATDPDEEKAKAEARAAARLEPKAPVERGYSREAPVEARFLSATLLNKGALGEGDLARRVRSRRRGPRLHRGRQLRRLPDERSRAGPGRDQGDRRAGRLPDRRQDARAGADRGHVAVAGARHAVRADLLHGGRASARRRPRRWRRARIPTATRRRSTCWRRSQVPRHPARPRSIRRMPRGAAAAALLDLLLAEGRSPPAVAHGRSRALRDRGRGPHAAGRRLDLPVERDRARHAAQGLYPARPQLRACRPIRRRRSSWSGRAPAWRRSAPSCTTAWRRRRRATPGCSSAISARTATSSTRTSSSALQERRC